jgi:hypothetical protein
MGCKTYMKQPERQAVESVLHVKRRNVLVGHSSIRRISYFAAGRL